ncbi:MAG: acyltransferase [Beijerinckiaceae bacterium]|nr:acyltransferase [Beijerinckiaceae bacterium]
MNPGNVFARASIGARLTATGNRPSGFDYLRLGLAISVVLVHSPMTTYGADPCSHREAHLWVTAPLCPSTRAILPMFFALSGFLVAGSLERSRTLLTFAGLRAIRIYPALAVEVVLSAFLIGAAVTTLPPGQYFSDPLFLIYLRNAIGDIQLFLPGVFANNPWPRMVNFQLWTVPFELLCYATLTGLALAGCQRHKILFPLAAAAMAIAHVVLRSYKYDWELPVMDGHFTGPLLVISFLAGLSLYLFRDKIVWSFGVFAGALIASFPMLWFGRYWDYPAIITVTYVTVYLGLTNFKRLSVIRGADYSYGIYLYGFVIQQFFVYLAAPRFWWVNALVCVPVACLFAAFSWHFVEKPAQKLKHPLAVAERHYLALKARLPAILAFMQRGSEHRAGG